MILISIIGRMTEMILITIICRWREQLLQFLYVILHSLQLLQHYRINIITIVVNLERKNQILLGKASHGNDWKYQETQALCSQKPSISILF